MDGRGLVAGCSFALLVVPDALFAPHDSFSLIPSLSTYPLHALPQPLQPKAIALSASCIVQYIYIACFMRHDLPFLSQFNFGAKES
jgi:hypothetical protein